MLRAFNSRILPWLIAALLLTTAAAAEAPAFRTLSFPDHPRFTSQRFGEDSGIGVITATALAQDRDGFLWIGSQTGLFRYDGSRVIRMSDVEPLVGHYINTVLSAPDDSVWVAGFRGVAHYVDGHFLMIPLPPDAGTPTAAAQVLAVDKHGTAYVAVQHGLVRIPGAAPLKTRWFGKSDGVDCAAEAVVVDSDDSAWFTCGHRLAQIAAGADRPEWDKALKLPQEHTVALLFDRGGNFWIRSSRHVDRIDRAHHALICDDKGVAPANEEGGTPLLDKDGDLLVPSMSGLFWRDRGRWRVITDKDGLSSNNVQVALQDSEGTLWVGGYGTGLDHLSGIRDWAAWTQAEGLPDNATWATARDHDRRLWVATPKGISIWLPDQHRWKVLTEKEGLSATETRELQVARDGSIWAIAVPGGITRIDPHNFKTQRITSFAGENFIFALADPRGDIWATTGKKLVRFDGGDPTPHPVEVSVPDSDKSEVWYLDFSPEGILWVCAPGRLLRYDGQSWRVFGRTEGLLGDSITSMAALTGNEIWIGYDDVVGVSRLQLDPQGNPHFERYAWDLAVVGKDSKRRVWFNGTDGIHVYSPDGNTLHLTEAQGLIWDDISPAGFREEDDGSYLISTTRGLARYNPHAPVAPPSPPRVLITAVSLGDQMETADNHPQVDYKHGNLYAQFTPLVLSNPDQITCRYRLAGLDDAYTESSIREVRYSSLPPGEYEFSVQCRNELSGWSADDARFRFTILPPWWQTTWFRGSSAFAGLLMVWGIVRLRTHALDRRRAQLERAVAERSAELMQKNRELEEISLTDPLTRARNRRYFYETIPADAAQVLRQYRGLVLEDAPIAIENELIFAMVDIDFFKVANDEHGHMAGDRLIQEIANRLSTLIRKSDVLVRWGGEEFLIVCRSTDRDHAALFCSRILEAISATPYTLESGAALWLTCSVGWAPYPWIPQAVDALTLEQVIEVADRALYLAKKTGRNQGIGLLPSEQTKHAPYDINLESVRDGDSTCVDVIRTANPATPAKAHAASASSSIPSCD